jgi:threonine aldolase
MPGPSVDPPSRSFASDNAAGAHPAVLDAVVAANAGHCLAYGEDAHTAHCEEMFVGLFDAEVVTRLTFNGTGANVAALACLMATHGGPNQAIVCSSWAHIHTDETAAPERILSTKLVDVPSDDAKLTPDQLREAAAYRGQVHHAQPGVVSITQPTELGTLYTVDEIVALCDTAHELGMLCTSTGPASPTQPRRSAEPGRRCDRSRSMPVWTPCRLGAPRWARSAPRRSCSSTRRLRSGRSSCANRLGSCRRRCAFSPPSSAPCSPTTQARARFHSNAMAELLHRRVATLPGIDAGASPEVNSIFPALPADLIEPLKAWSFFWDWNPARHQVRWMTAWDTTPEDIDAFVAGIEEMTGRGAG